MEQTEAAATTTTETTATTEETAATEATRSDTVSRIEFERMTQDMLKYKKAAKEAADQKAAEIEARLRGENKWQELAEAKEREAAEARTKAERIEQSYLNEKKYNAVHAKAVSLGLRPEAVADLDMLDLEALQVETTSTGKINILGADKFAESLKARKPHWFGAATAPKVDAKGRRITESNGSVTLDDVMKAEAEGRKSGDRTKYYELHKQYQQQRQTGRAG